MCNLFVKVLGLGVVIIGGVALSPPTSYTRYVDDRDRSKFFIYRKIIILVIGSKNDHGP